MYKTLFWDILSKRRSSFGSLFREHLKLVLRSIAVLMLCTEIVVSPLHQNLGLMIHADSIIGFSRGITAI